MANFAVSASEEVINQGNELLERLAQPGERKADTLSRLFSMVSDQIDGQIMKDGGVDVQALDSSLNNIRNMFLASVSGKEQIMVEKDAKIAEIKAMKEQMEADLRSQLDTAKAEKEQAEKISEAAAKSAAQAIKDAEATKEQAETAKRLVAEKDRTISTLADKLATAEEKATSYNDLKTEKDNLQEKCKDLERQLYDAKNAQKALEADFARQIETSKAQAELNLERAVMAKEREIRTEYQEQIRQADRENARLSLQIEQLQEQIKQISKK